MTTQQSVYAVYLTVATSEHPVGYVENNIVWDGVSTLGLPSGLAVVQDAARKYPIGSIYTPPVTTTGTAA